MNSSTTTGWTSWSVMSGLLSFGVGLMLVTVCDCANDLKQMQAELPNAPVYFSAETVLLPGQGQVTFQCAASER